MSFWRPSDSCQYIISDINGLHNELQLILSRILPLRKTGGQLDKLIFLGNYTGTTKSHETIDLLIKANNENKNQITFLCGDNDIKLIKSLNNGDASDFRSWLASGGESTLIGYFNRIGIEQNPYLVQRQYISRFIPNKHIHFINSLKYYHETEDCIYVHGGCDPNIELSKQSNDVLVGDMSVFKYVLNSGNRFICPWNKKIITGGGKLHNKPLIKNKFISLDANYAERLYVLELNSMSMFSARKGKCRLVKESIT